MYSQPHRLAAFAAAVGLTVLMLAGIDSLAMQRSHDERLARLATPTAAPPASLVVCDKPAAAAHVRS